MLRDHEQSLNVVGFSFFSDILKHNTGMMSEQLPVIYKCMTEGKIDNPACPAEVQALIKEVGWPVFINDMCPKEFGSESWQRLQAELCYKNKFKRCDLAYGCPMHGKSSLECTA